MGANFGILKLPYKKLMMSAIPTGPDTIRDTSLVIIMFASKVVPASLGTLLLPKKH